ncbi:8-oxo-dGDP phosphatase NUDT18 [Cheilinus undulatus]|uniref:8-oxo-dGDP phosphatase NUDT18-like n=1 Tax=Cheilinus undulatus TaxID=241271 RepID=UPI001BD2EFA7|nr:8-oxo-dGDP phosphatase NUDT18-like [Cheilinus undulatus]XP_041638447.1 8-oxo-dGDP phosphatase NUDT18-like [Cheilinus undulatus]XP_041638448.1 8-oxo-dGDP phosphatase NUDT18-like [Cheilinus undulatus]XP_041642686.1 8-oxo-dGDP phosphatase NUDT18 [Cheilinus undulatus]XP_041642687.1 8-oxo-dGDP phosphatase NUDT18 [Cheilinus undulatus]XP_041642688.1 8-oxo-dGDP phosphatase NUDT18 [Cheilinus undulatus]
MEVTEEERRQVEEQVEWMMSGQGCDVTLCDVGLEQSKPATLRKNVTYIVAAVIFNEKEEVLMVQEAKQDCYKQWYLPAGRMEVGESLVEALRREVKEEAGLECEPITLLLIQEQGPQWIRFIFLARVTGGTLKSLSAADQESLQASWWDRQSALTLRGRDILRLIECGLKYHQTPWHPVTLPMDMSCRHVVQRLVLVFTHNDAKIWVLVIKAPTPHLPTAAAVKTHAVTWAANMVVQEAMPKAYYDHDVNTLGVFSLQHNGRQHGKTDGVCFNTLVALVPDYVQRDEDGEKIEWKLTGKPPPVENSRYVWCEVRKIPLKEKLLEMTKNTSILPIHSLY